MQFSLVVQGTAPEVGTNVPIIINENCLKCVRDQYSVDVNVI